MQQQDKNENTPQHDVDEHNRKDLEKTPPGSFTGTNIDRYVTGEIPEPPEEPKQEKDAKLSSNK